MTHMGRRPRVPGELLALMKAEAHHTWTLDELHSGLGMAGVKADFSTVFRAVAKLEGEGAVGRLELDDGRTHFELRSDHHDHLRCLACGEVTAVPCGLLDSSLAAIAQATGFTVSDHHLVLTGTCARCARAAHPAYEISSSSSAEVVSLSVAVGKAP